MAQAAEQEAMELPGGCRRNVQQKYSVTGAQFERVVTLDEETARGFATFVGDLNPIHHDAAFAARSRFGGLIVSGTQTTAMMLAMTASYLSQFGPCLGLDAGFRFRRGIRMGETVRMVWTVVSITPKPGLGDLVAMEAVLSVVATGEIALTGTSTGVLLHAKTD
jgi:3-hydroxybutyryl-CoA dehydratase